MIFLSVPLPEDIDRLVKQGRFRDARTVVDSYLSMDIPDLLRKRLKYENERMFRLKHEYSISAKKAVTMLKKSIVDITRPEIEEWHKNGALDLMNINGHQLYFSRFVDNLIFARPELAQRRVNKPENKTAGLLLQTLIRMSSGELRRYRITGSIKLYVRKSVSNDRFRVWLPVPREGFQIEKVKILKTHPEISFLSDSAQRTAYFYTKERKIKIEFSYEISEIAGGMEGDVKDTFLSEKLPHIRFTPFLRNLEKVITEGVDDKYGKLKLIYDWVTSHMRYFYVRNYGTYENIAEYAASNMKGDCGFHAILFITLARLAGIPAKWQSGWFISPYSVNPHDWAQVYIDDKWIPVDTSFGNIRRHTREENKFYMGNLDAFRMIANDDILVNFEPKKKFWRSDPVDNQVGEIETEHGNLYYDKFTWKLNIKEFKRVG